MTEERNTAEILVDAAIQLLETGGPEALTLRAVGAKAGVSRTAPYRHFKDKNDLLRAVGTQALNDLQKAMKKGADNVSGDGTALYRACLGYAEQALNHPARYNLIFGPQPLEEPPASMEEAANIAVSNFYSYVATAQKEDGLIPGDVRVITAILWSALHGIVSLTLSGHLREPRMVDGETRYPELIHHMILGMTQ